MRYWQLLLLGLSLSSLPACKSSFEPTELTGFPAAAGAPPPRPSAGPGGNGGIKMKGDTAPAPAPATAPSSSDPTPEQVCNHMIDIVARGAGGMDANMRREAMNICLEQMRPEKASRGAEWGPLARCVLGAQNDADIGRCDDQFPKDGAASGGIQLKGGGGASSSGGSGDAEAVLKALFLSSSEVPSGLQPLSEPALEVDQQNGYIIGLGIWINPNNNTLISGLFDVRYFFQSEQEAASWLAANSTAQSEGLPKLSNAPMVGQDCTVYGGVKDGLRAYVYLFRRGQVVVKLFISQGDGAGTLGVDQVAPYARKIESKLAAAQ